MALKVSLVHRKLDLENLSFLVSTNIKILELSSNHLNDKVKKTEDYSRKIIDEINMLRQRLNLVNKEWEKWKIKLILFKNYEGILREAICKNTKNTKQELCKVKKLKEK